MEFAIAWPDWPGIVTDCWAEESEKIECARSSRALTAYDVRAGKLARRVSGGKSRSLNEFDEVSE